MADPCYIDGDTIYLFEHEECYLEGKQYLEWKDLLSRFDRVRTLEFTEYGLDIKEVKDKGLAPITVRTIIKDENDVYQVYLKTSEYVGFLSVNGYNLVILPKFFREGTHRETMIETITSLLLHMINRVLFGVTPSEDFLYRIKSSFEVARTFRIYNLLFELLGVLYVETLYRELVRGIYREYVVVEGEEKFLRGKLILLKQIRKLPHQLTRFSVRYHKLSADNRLNRILFYAAYLVYRRLHVHRALRTARRIMELLREAETRRNPLVEGRPVFHRLNERFYNAYILAEMIIEGLGFWPRHEVHGIIINMNTLFQYYIYNIISEYFTAKSEEDIGNLLKIDDKDVFEQKPDIIVYIDENKVFIIDAKYTNLPKYPEEMTVTERKIKSKIIPAIRQVYVYCRMVQGYPNFKECLGTALVYVTYEPGISHDKRKYVIAFEKEEQPLYIIRYNMGLAIKNPNRSEKEFIEMIKSIIEQGSS